MANSKSVDQDAVLRARMMLLGSGRRSLREEVQAYRVLVQVSPRAYLGKLATALVSYSYAPEFKERPEIVFALCGEAVEAARKVEAEDPQRAAVLVRALGAYERELFAAGRREEGLAACREAAEAGPEGSARLGVVLAEEGRYAAAAEVSGREPGASVWALVRHAGNLEAAGQHGAASETVRRLVDGRRRALAAREGSSASVLWALVQHSRMAGTTAAGAVRAEALGLLKELAVGGERGGWSDAVPFWKTLLALSARSLEPGGFPAPAFGADVALWSPDVRRAWFAGLDGLEREAADPDAGPRQLRVVQHRLTVRSALFHENRTLRMEQALRPLFDRSVELAREPGDGEWLARTLTDRAMFLVVVRRYREAYEDYREAVELLN
ncbi:hypothetical protein ACVNF4_13155 [Streptomyces sp. S6]